MSINASSTGKWRASKYYKKKNYKKKTWVNLSGYHGAWKVPRGDHPGHSDRLPDENHLLRVRGPVERLKQQSRV